jgi:archaellum component FlaC
MSKIRNLTRSDLAHVEKAIVVGFGRMDHKFEEIDRRFDTLEQKVDDGFERVDKQLVEVNSKIEILTQDVEDLAAATVREFKAVRSEIAHAAIVNNR